MSTSTQQFEPERPHDPAFEKHYSITQLSKLWGWSYDKVRRLFEHEPGVLRTVSNGTLKKRKYVCLVIPESVVIRVHHRIGVQQ